MSYTPPAHGAVDFDFTGSYTPPAHGSTDFDFGSAPPGTAITGVAGTGAAGTVGKSRTIALTGAAGTSHVGTVSASSAAGTAITGNAATGAAGTAHAAHTVTLTGAAAATAVGTVTVLTGINIALTGAAATGARGSLGQSRTVALRPPAGPPSPVAQTVYAHSFEEFSNLWHGATGFSGNNGFQRFSAADQPMVGIDGTYYAGYYDLIANPGIQSQAVDLAGVDTSIIDGGACTVTLDWLQGTPDTAATGTGRVGIQFWTGLGSTGSAIGAEQFSSSESYTDIGFHARQMTVDVPATARSAMIAFYTSLGAQRLSVAFDDFSMTLTPPDPGAYQVGVGLVGNIYRGIDQGITGNGATTAAGSLVAGQALAGRVGTTGLGAVALEHIVALSGSAAAGSTGTLHGQRTLGATGAAAAGQLGDYGIDIDQPAHVTKVTGTTALGDIALGKAFGLHAPTAARGRVSSVGASVAITLGGLEALGAAGDIGYTGAGTARLVRVTGLGRVGSVPARVTLALTGAGANGAAGDLLAGAGTALHGVPAVATTGSVAASVDVWLAGLVATAQQGLLVESQGLTGAGAAGSTGNIRTTRTLALHGVLATAIPGIAWPRNTTPEHTPVLITTYRSTVLLAPPALQHTTSPGKNDALATIAGASVLLTMEPG